MIRKVGEVRERLLVRLHHIVCHVLQLASVLARHHRRRLLRVVELGRQSVVDQTATMRVHAVRVRVVRVRDVATRVVLRLRRVHQQLLHRLLRLRLVRHRVLRLTLPRCAHLLQRRAHRLDLLLLRRRQVAHLARRNAAPQLAGTHRLVGRHHRTGGDGRAFTDVREVENGRSFADQTVVVDRARVNDGIRSDHTVVSDGGRTLLWGTVNVDNHVITKMCVGPNSDRSYITYSLAHEARNVPRIVTPYQAEESLPMVTLPDTEAEVATKHASDTFGF